ncbi:hypothetical protein [Sorangium atrum]|uniref:Uncharacterized protein n=1 Tax=Sorangium atrum TaxID=2995308 RepID=A0ABT5CEJ6_9BACT|nr:hypothetical protein [Sorangium aterium]MDC0684023.1 hypothetical protein [Sorangium aterium]
MLLQRGVELREPLGRHHLPEIVRRERRRAQPLQGRVEAVVVAPPARADLEAPHRLAAPVQRDEQRRRRRGLGREEQRALRVFAPGGGLEREILPGRGGRLLRRRR